MAAGVAVEIPLAGKSRPPGEDGEGYDFAGTEGGIRTWAAPLSRTRLLEIVHDDVECGEEGVHVEHKSSVPFPWGSGSKPTLKGGHLPLKSSIYNSHQALNVPKSGHMAYARRYSGRYTATVVLAKGGKRTLKYDSTTQSDGAAPPVRGGMIRVSRNVSILSVMVMMTVTVMATVTVAFATPNEGGNGQAKVEVCHKGQIITVAQPAVAAHERHGDTLGPCAEGTTLELTTQATTPVTLGQPISDTATLSGGDNPTGTITFNVYGPDDEDCSGEPAFTSVVDVNGNGDYSSDPTPSDLSDDFVPEAAGTYRWTADYSSDDNNDAVTSACNAENEASVVTE